MIAIEIRESGGPDVLQAVERARPELREGEVIIRVDAAGVNRPDIMQRLGKYPPPAGASDVPGLEVAGTIAESAAPNWTRRRSCLCAGLWWRLRGILRRTSAAVSAHSQGLDAASAAALPETFFTVWTNLFERGSTAAR